MPLHDTPVDSSSGWVADHIRTYVDSDGAEGHIWQGVPTLLLTTLGRTSGQPRRTALIYGEDAGSYVVVASQGGAPEHPSWYRNLSESPTVRLQVGARKVDAHARTASALERARLWPLMTGIWPAYDEYQTKTDREIPLVVLEPLT